jgi:hypothetical protein
MVNELYKNIAILVSIALSAVYIFTSNEFFGSYTRIIIVGCNVLAVALFVTTYMKPRTIDIAEMPEDRDKQHFLQAQQSPTSQPPPISKPDVKELLEKADKMFKEEKKEDIFSGFN